jgi:DNA-binding ferritin-like protein
MYLSYQTSHWQVVGGSFYGNHLLFQRLYESVQGQVDQLAEKISGYLGSEAVALNHQMKHISEYTYRWSSIDCNHKRGLQSEADLQQALKRAYGGIKQAQAMSLGLDDWIMATANAHEENEYLLQQALAPIPGEGKQAARQPRSRKDLIGYFYALHDALEKDFPYSAEQINAMDAADLKKSTARLSDSLARTDAGADGAVERAMENAPAAYKQLSRIVGGKLAASGASTDEGYFYKAPNQRAVLEFARSKAISNDVVIAEKASKEDHLDISEAEAVAEAKAAPPLPTEIAKEPGAAAVSTLNQYVIKSEDPVAEQAVKMNEARMASWLKELE